MIKVSTWFLLSTQNLNRSNLLWRYKEINCMKVWIDEGCISCRACEEICPDVFEVDDDGCYVIEDNVPGNDDGIYEAAESCPVEVIVIEEEDDDDEYDYDDDGEELEEAEEEEQ